VTVRRKVGVLCITAEASCFACLAALLFPAFDVLLRTDAAGEIDFVLGSPETVDFVPKYIHPPVSTGKLPIRG